MDSALSIDLEASCDGVNGARIVPEGFEIEVRDELVRKAYMSRNAAMAASEGNKSHQ